MSKKTQQNRSQPQPQTILAEGETVATAAEASEASAEIVDLQQRQSRRVNALDALNATKSESLRNKVALLSETETAIAEVAKLAGNRERNEADEAKLVEAASRAGLLLYRGRIAGVFSADELTEMLGKSFGFKKKADNTLSKTPFGTGENIRKRVVRAVNAYDYAVRGAEPVALFEPIERNAIKPLLNQLESGDMTIWAFYNTTSEMKATATGNRPKVAFDPKRIVGLAGMLGENVAESVRIVHETPGLLESYAGLQRVMDTVFTEYTAKYPKDVEAA